MRRRRRYRGAVTARLEVTTLVGGEQQVAAREDAHEVDVELERDGSAWEAVMRHLAAHYDAHNDADLHADRFTRLLDVSGVGLDDEDVAESSDEQ